MILELIDRSVVAPFIAFTGLSWVFDLTVFSELGQAGITWLGIAYLLLRMYHYHRHREIDRKIKEKDFNS